MTIFDFITAFIEENEQSSTLQIDDDLILKLDKVSQGIHLTSPLAIDELDHYSQLQAIKQAMSWSYGWQKSPSCIAANNGQYYILTPLEVPFSLSIVNAHCQFAAQCQQLTLNPIQQRFHHAHLLP